MTGARQTALGVISASLAACTAEPATTWPLQIEPGRTLPVAPLDDAGFADRWPSGVIELDRNARRLAATPVLTACAWSDLAEPFSTFAWRPDTSDLPQIATRAHYAEAHALTGAPENTTDDAFIRLDIARLYSEASANLIALFDTDAELNLTLASPIHPDPYLIFMRPDALLSCPPHDNGACGLGVFLGDHLHARILAAHAYTTDTDRVTWAQTVYDCLNAGIEDQQAP